MKPLVMTVKHTMRRLILLLEGTKFWSSSLMANDATVNDRESSRLLPLLFATMCTTAIAKVIAPIVASQH